MRLSEARSVVWARLRGLTRAWRGSRSRYVPTLLTVALFLVAGSRLITLSLQHHAALERERAGALAADYAARIEPALARLLAATSKAAQQGSAAEAGDGLGGRATTHLKGIYWTNPEGAQEAGRAEPGIMAGIDAEWQAAQSSGRVPASAMLGPLRLGSQWLVSFRVPAGNGSVVSYADLDLLLADAHLARLIDAGYDFELSQSDPRSGRPRIFVSSRTEELAEPQSHRISLPTAPAVAGSYLELSLQPRSGWVSSALLLSEISLLVFVTWIAAFGLHDLLHALERTRGTLRRARARIHALNQRLAAEIQQRMGLQQSFDFARLHDTFTGLPNRRAFMDQLDRALREVRVRDHQSVAVVLVDIARFKTVNYLLGQTAGDDLIGQVAKRFEHVAQPPEGFLARWGTDQLALLLLDAPSGEEARRTGEKLKSELREPFQLRRHKLLVTATVGVAWANSGQKRTEDMVREADIALSVAKREHSAGVVLYEPAMISHSPTLVSLEADLHVALEKHQLQLLFQPIVDLRTHEMVGAEALLRWCHPIEGVLSPDRFLRTAEEAGLMVPITRWVILKVIQMAAEWIRQLPQGRKFYVSINLSPSALRDPDLSSYLAALLKETRLPARMLKLELNELALVADVAGARETLTKLHDMGIQLMLDDFGTGYSSIRNLQSYPFDVVKIDCPAVNRGGADDSNMRMIAGMVQIARSLDLASIAETVEGNGAASKLLAVGCQYGQGRYFSEPVDANAILQRLQSRTLFDPAGAPGGTDVPEDTGATMMVATLDEATLIAADSSIDTSQTMIIPLESIKAHPAFGGDDDDDDLEEE